MELQTWISGLLVLASMFPPAEALALYDPQLCYVLDGFLGLYWPHHHRHVHQREVLQIQREGGGRRPLQRESLRQHNKHKHTQFLFSRRLHDESSVCFIFTLYSLSISRCKKLWFVVLCSGAAGSGPWRLRSADERRRERRKSEFISASSVYYRLSTLQRFIKFI
uniref:Secreted protein n=1 Tax=Lates calcarifer TaxID=8187 RepID=A0A4W6FTT4_LATCA